MTAASNSTQIVNPNAHLNSSDNMRPRDAALYLGVSESLLAKLRMRPNRNIGPRYIKISGCVIYRRGDLDDWLDQNTVDGCD